MTLFEPKTLLPGVPVGVPRALAEAAISAAQAGAGSMGDGQADFGAPAGDGQAAFAGPIDEQAIAGAMQTLRRYRAGKAGLERRIVENEEYWKLRHWDHMAQTGTTALKTKSAWLVNVLLSKHADAMDAYPEPTCLPREPGDADTARLLSAVLPVVLGQNDFERVWSDNWWKKLKAGFALYGVFWDRERLDGRGDIAICPVDPLNLYWEPGVTELQDSKELFYVRLEDNETLLAAWPQLAGKLGALGGCGLGLRCEVGLGGLLACVDRGLHHLLLGEGRASSLGHGLRGRSLNPGVGLGCLALHLDGHAHALCGSGLIGRPLLVPLGSAGLLGGHDGPLTRSCRRRRPRTRRRPRRHRLPRHQLRQRCPRHRRSWWSRPPWRARGPPPGASRRPP